MGINVRINDFKKVFRKFGGQNGKAEVRFPDYQEGTE